MAAGAAVALIAARSLSASRPRALFLFAAALRATLLLGTPGLSDDLRRYVWDGRVAAAGFSPYALAPADPALDGVARGGRRPPHADVRTVYPPAAQAVFRFAVAGATLLGAADVADRGASLVLRAVFALADAGVVLLILAMGGAGAGWAAALYAFHPLAATESAKQGHLDSLGVLLLLASLVYLSRGDGLSRGSRLRAGIAFALSVLTKYVPLAASLPLARKGRAAFIAAAAATGVAIEGAAWRQPVAPFGGLGVFARRWEFNSLAYSTLERLFAATGLPDAAKRGWIALKAALGHPGWMQAAFPYFYAGFLARAALALLLAAALLAILRIRDVETAVFASLAALLLASPTLHPWYLLWLLPFAARRRDPAVLWLAFAVPASYALLAPVPGLPHGAILFFEYAPAALLYLVSLERRRRAALVPAA